jgi:hypothetical protein
LQVWQTLDGPFWESFFDGYEKDYDAPKWSRFLWFDIDKSIAYQRGRVALRSIRSLTKALLTFGRFI